MSKYILSLLVVLFAMSICQAQQHRYSWKLGVHGGVATYFGDLSHQFADMPHQFRQPIRDANFLSYGLSLEHHISKEVGLRLGLMRHQITASDRSYEASTNYSRALNVQTDLYEAELLATFYLDNGRVFGEKAVISPYFLIGGGLTYFVPKGDLLNANGDRYHYWSDNTIRDIAETAPNALNAQIVEQDYQYETALRPILTEGFKYQQITWNVAAGLGFKFRLSKRFHLHLEALIRYTGSDFLDDVSADYLPSYNDNFQAYAANPSNANRQERGNTPNMNDWYSNVGLSLHYSFGQKTFKIRPSIIYTKTIALNDSVVVETLVSDSKQEAIDLVNNENPTEPVQDTLVVRVMDTVKVVIQDTQRVEKTPVSEPVVDTAEERIAVVVNDTLIEYEVDSLTGDSLKKETIVQEIIKEKIVVDTTENTTENNSKDKEALMRQMYEYELRLQELTYKAKLREQDLTNELQRANPDAAYQKMDKDYQQKIRDLELKMEKQANEAALKALEQKQAQALDGKNNEVESVKKERAQDQKNYEYELKLKEQNYQHQLELLKLKHQFELEKAEQQAKPRQKDTVFLQPNVIKVETGSVAPKESIGNSIAVTPNVETENPVFLVDSGDMTELRLRNEMLRLKIKELELEQERLVDQKPKTDTIYKEITKTTTVANNNDDTELKKELDRQKNMSSDLVAKVEQLKNEKAQEALRTDSLLAEIKRLEAGEKAVSNELQNFLSKGQSTYVTKIFFDVGKSSLTIQAKETISTLMHQLKNYPDVAYLVKGFASKTGNSEVNQRLSTERAAVVANYLKELNIDAGKISMDSLGDKQSVSANELDRRAEIHLFYPKK